MSDETPQRQTLTSLNIATILLTMVVLFGVCFLSSPPPARTPTGARAWAEDSILHAVTTALAFDFAIPTLPAGAEVKGLISGVGAGLAVIVAALAHFLMARARQQEAVWVEPDTAAPSDGKKHIDPLSAGQGLLAAGCLIAFLVSWWADLPDLALGGAVLLLTQVLWAFALCHSLNVRACHILTSGLTALMAACAVLALIYFYVRNPHLRLGYPIGNPLFFAACMITPLVLCVTGTIAALRQFAKAPGRAAACIGGYAVAAATMSWAVLKAQPRSTYVGLGAALNTLILLIAFRQRGARRWALLLGLVIADVGGYALLLEPRLEARGQTIRTRLYAWTYAQDLIVESPVFGHGVGGFALKADGRATQDVLADPHALADRLAHTHNEWLELFCDLGSFGLVTFLGALVVTFVAAWRALPALHEGRDAWLLIGLLSALAGICAEELTDVALRIVALPTVFYVVLGLTWAMIASARPPQRLRGAGFAGVVLTFCAILGLTSILASVWDFRAARAQYEQNESLQQRRWDEAAALAETAGRWRLSPGRRITAELSRAGVHLDIARAYLEDLQRTVGEIRGMPNPPPHMQGVLADYHERTRLHAEQCLALLQPLVNAGGPMIGAHSLAGSAHEILSAIAAGTGFEDAARQHHEAALEAYLVENTRQPFNSQLVWRILQLSPQMPDTQILNLLAPIMQYNQLDQRFLGLVQQLGERPSFQEELARGVTTAQAAIAVPTADVSPYAAQFLRIAAWIDSQRNRMESARQLSRGAADLLIPQRELFPIAPTVALSELAFFSFLASGGDPEPALDAARQAEMLLPASDEARVVGQQLLQQRARYELARGGPEGEAAALACFRQIADGPINETAALSSTYYEMCSRLIGALPPAHRPAYLEERIARLAALAPQNPAADILRATLAFESYDFPLALQYLRAALSRNADPEQILSLAINGMSPDPHPHNLLIEAFIDELRASAGAPHTPRPPASASPDPAAPPTGRAATPTQTTP